MPVRRRHPTAVRRFGAGCLSLLAIVLMVPAAAAAATSCEYNGAAEVLTVSMPESGDAVQLTVSGSEIVIRGTGLPLPCGGPPTLTNTEFINLIDGSGNGNTQITILNPARLDPNVKILLSAGGGLGDVMNMRGDGATANNYVFGASGIETDR